MSADEPGSDSLGEKLLDVFLYAPLGLVLDAEALAPDLATRGRQHRAAARQIGEIAVKRGLGRLEGTLEQFQAEQDRSGDSARSEAEPKDEAEPEPSAADGLAPSADGLAITEYDLLAASQVVKRLGALGSDELEAVRQYETGTRGRRTILAKIARLQS